MPIVTDYRVVGGTAFRLPNADDGVNKEFSFELPNNTIIAQSHLCWVVSAIAGQPTYTIRLNGSLVLQDTIAHLERRVTNALTNALRRGANTLAVERTSNSGSFGMDDIILYHQKDI